MRLAMQSVSCLTLSCDNEIVGSAFRSTNPHCPLPPSCVILEGLTSILIWSIICDFIFPPDFPVWAYIHVPTLSYLIYNYSIFVTGFIFLGGQGYTCHTTVLCLSLLIPGIRGMNHLAPFVFLKTEFYCLAQTDFELELLLFLLITGKTGLCHHAQSML